MKWNENISRWTCFDEEELIKLASEWLSWLSFYYCNKNESLILAEFKDLVINQIIEGEEDPDSENWFDVISLSEEEREVLYQIIETGIDNCIREKGENTLVTEAIEFKNVEIDDLIHQAVTYFEEEYKSP